MVIWCRFWSCCCCGFIMFCGIIVWFLGGCCGMNWLGVICRVCVRCRLCRCFG